MQDALWTAADAFRILQRNAMMTGQYKKISGYVIVVVCVVILVVSCGDPIGGTGKAPVFLVIDNVAPIECDVYQSGVVGHVRDDTTTIQIKVVPKNPGAALNTFSDVIIQEYRVYYFRPDGNQNVPEPFFQLVTSSPASVTIIVVRADAKLKKPLVNLAFGGGEGEILMNAVVEFFGEDLAGNQVSTSVVIPILAKDFTG